MNLKTGILAAAALTLAVPAAALAQPAYRSHGGYREDVRRDDFRRDDFRREDRGRDVRRAEEFRRLQWEREHHRYGYGYAYR